MLQQTYGENCMSLTQCYELFNRFNAVRTSTDENSRSRWPSTSRNNNNIHEVRGNRWLIVPEVAEEVVCISYTILRCTASPQNSSRVCWQFQKGKIKLNLKRTSSINEIEQNMIRLRSIHENAFQETFQKLKKHWERCIASRRNYFKGF